MIISFSGKIGSGKDLAGNICKILLQSPHLNNEGVEKFSMLGLGDIVITGIFGVLCLKFDIDRCIKKQVKKVS